MCNRSWGRYWLLHLPWRGCRNWMVLRIALRVRRVTGIRYVLGGMRRLRRHVMRI